MSSNPWSSPLIPACLQSLAPFADVGPLRRDAEPFMEEF
jgi:hypothetical protein